MGVYVNDEVGLFDLSRALDEVSSERRSVALRYRHDLDRRLSVAVYLLLKEALQAEYGLTGNPRLALGPNGKPYLTDHPDVHFNFSHCTKAAVCAVSDRPVGIDVETIAPVDLAVARRILSDGEFAELNATTEPEIVFVRLWTRKEAIVKLSGSGIEEIRLQSILEEARGIGLETTVCREKGYVISLARENRR